MAIQFYLTKQGQDMGTVHFVLQGKGGAGKSFVANIIGQYAKQLDSNNIIIDTDPLNQSLYKIKGLNCEYINILNQQKDDIDQRKFDEIIECTLASSAEHIVIDTGSSSFLQLSTYIKKQNVIALLNGIGYQTKFHFVVNGGSEQNEAMKLTIEFAKILSDVESQNRGCYDFYKPLVLWLNPMPDQLRFDNEDNDIYKDHSYILLEPLLDTIVCLPIYSQDGVVKRDVFSMKDNLLTFDEFYQQPYDKEAGKFGFMAKARMKEFQKSLYNAIEPIFTT